MGIEDMVLWTLVVLLAAGIMLFAKIMSWGFISMADCIMMDFDPACYSVHENKPVSGVDDPMWWPQKEDE